MRLVGVLGDLASDGDNQAHAFHLKGEACPI